LHPETGEIKPPGLFLLSRQCVRADEAVHLHGMSVAAGFQEVTLIASVPLTGDEWRPLSEGEIVAVSAGRVTGARTP
jgi:predicted glutamine amidotransferase